MKDLTSQLVRDLDESASTMEKNWEKERKEIEELRKIAQRMRKEAEEHLMFLSPLTKALMHQNREEN